MDSLVVKFDGAIHKSINDLMCITESMKTSVARSPAQGLMRISINSKKTCIAKRDEIHADRFKA